MGWASKQELADETDKILSDNISAEVSKIDNSILIRSLGAGKQAVISKLRARGYTLAQINLWARQHEFHLDISMWFALPRRKYRKDDKQSWIDKTYDRREELETVDLYKDDATASLITAGDEPQGAYRQWDLEKINLNLGETP